MRGIEKRPIFNDRRDRLDFADRLSELLPELGFRCYAWAFLDNHVHLVVQTGPVPLSQLMRRINTGYAVCFNLRHKRSGYLFQNRYHSRHVTDDADLMGVTRYVFRNPLLAGHVHSLADLEHYPWCGYGGFVGARAPHPFESVEDLWALFGGSSSEAPDRIRAWMTAPEPMAVQSDHSLRGMTIEATQEPSPRSDEPSDIDMESLIDDACEHFGITRTQLLSGARRRTISRARAAICFLGVFELGIPASHLARALNVKAGAVSQALERGRVIAREEEISLRGVRETS
jgi:REP element-mobilizing transposase RayT